MWGYIYLRDLYILAKHFFLDADLFFLFEHRKKGICAAFKVDAAGPENLIPFFMALFIFLDLNYFLMLEIFFVVVSKLDRCLSNNVINEYIQWSFLVEIIVDNL